MEFRTDRLLLRTYRSGDDAELLTYYGDPDVCRYLLHGPWTADDAAAAVGRRAERTGLDVGALAMVAELDGAVVGNVEAWTTDDESTSVEIGWTFSPAVSGRGLATEAVDALLRLVFDAPTTHRVVAQMDARNDASARLARRVGMTQEAHFRQNWWCKGEWTDTLVFARLRGDRPT